MLTGHPQVTTAVVTCDTADGLRRAWSVVREGPSDAPRLRIVIRRRARETEDAEIWPAGGSEPARHDAPGALDLEPAVERLDVDRPTQPEAKAPPTDAPRDRGRRESEWMVGAGVGLSIGVLQSQAGRRYVTPAVSWGRDLTADGGPGFLRGRLMWAIEAVPLYWQTSPRSTYGAGVSPLVWRWRFTPRPRAAAFAELAFGGLFTSDEVPEGTVQTNFMTHGAFGLKWKLSAQVSLVTAYRFQHISNGNQTSTNPGSVLSS
jgi:hypothetical protein